VALEDFENSTPIQPVSGSLTEGRIIGIGALINSVDYNKKKFSFTPETSGTYYFSCWLKSSNSGNLIITISNSSLVASKQFSISATSEWEYYTFLVDVEEGEQDLIIETTVNATIDEIAFYPEYANYSYVHYGANYLPIAQTNRLGQTTKMDYDAHGNPTASWDKDGLLVAEYSQSKYSMGIFTANEAYAMVDWVGDIVAGVPATFYVKTTYECSSFLWNIVPSNVWEANPDTINDFSHALSTSIPELTHTFSGDPNDWWVISVKMECYNVPAPIITTTNYVHLAYPPVQIDLCHDRPTAYNVCLSDQANYINCSGSRIADTLQMSLDIHGGSEQFQVKWFRIAGSGTSIVSSIEVGSSENFSTTDFLDSVFTYEVTDTKSRKKYKGQELHFNTFQGTINCSDD
jgi:YD repeat-containing protein